MEQMLSDYINGNLKEAKARAKRYSFARIYAFLEEQGQFTHETIYAIARYLKGIGSFETACKAELDDKKFSQYFRLNYESIN